MNQGTNRSVDPARLRLRPLPPRRRHDLARDGLRLALMNRPLWSGATGSRRNLRQMSYTVSAPSNTARVAK